MTRSPSPSPAPLHLVSTRDIPAAAAPDTVLERAFAAAAEGRIPAAAAQLEADLGQEPHALSPLRRAAFELMSGIAQMVRGDYEEALRRVLPALPPLEASAHATQLAWAYTAIGFGLGSLGDPERGLEWVGRAIALAEREQQPINALKALSDQGCLLGMLESHDAACRALESSLAVARRLCLPYAQAGCLNNLAYTHLMRARRIHPTQPGDARPRAAAQALARADEAWRIASESSLPQAQAWALNNRAQALLMLGRHDEAAEVLDRAEPLAAPFAQIRIDLMQARAALCRARGSNGDARAWLDQALAAADDQGYELARGRLLEDRVRLEVEAGQAEAALEWSQRRHDHMEAHYLRRLKTVARGAEIFAEAERARLEVASTRRRAQALTEVNHALRQESRHWQSAALRDSLTQLLNRRGLEEHARALIHRPIPLAVLVIDADHFKGVNDQHGHAIGDAVLRHLAELFTSHGRVSDIVARTGGEEFVLLLADIDAEATEAACERLRQQVERHAWALLVPGLAVTVSIGAAVRRGPIDLDSLLREADAALYRAKAAGRNRVRMAPRR